METQDGVRLTLSEFRRKQVLVLFFYPKDVTLAPWAGFGRRCRGCKHGAAFDDEG
jgi:peroxiredoxin